MPWYVFKCARCGRVKDVTLPTEKRDAWKVYCTHAKCARVDDLCEMTRQPTAANFTVTGYAAKNGYAK